VSFLFLGEVMLRLAPAVRGEPLGFAETLSMTPGGSEANTAVALAGLEGARCTLLSGFPATPPGRNCLARVRARGVEPVALPTRGARMGLYWHEPGIGARAGSVVYDRAGSAFDLADPDTPACRELLEALLPQCGWFHSSGVTPGISHTTARLLDRCLELLPGATPFSFDLNYRSRLWGWTDPAGMRETYARVCARADLVVGNCQDFQDCLGIGDPDAPDYDAIARDFFTANPRARCMGVNLRTSHSATRNTWSGALFVREAGGARRYQGPELELDAIVDRLGAGDAFTAGLLHGLSRPEPDFQQTVDRAVALAAMKHYVWGDFISAPLDDVLATLRAGASGLVRR